MFKYFIKIAYRTFLRNKLNSLINIFGLAIGLSCFILISLYTNYEFNWDTHNENYKNIFLINEGRIYNGEKQYNNQTTGALTYKLKEQIPEIEKGACIGEVWGEILSSSFDKTFYEPHGFYADNAVFDLLTFDFIAGDPNTALSDPLTMVLSRSLAEKYFESVDVIGKTIYTDNYTFRVTGVYEDLPINTQYRASYFVPLDMFKLKYDLDVMSSWESPYFRNLIQLKSVEQTEEVSIKIAELINEYLVEDKLEDVYLFPLKQLHVGKQGNGFYVIVSIYAFLGILILLLSAINFLNLSTAQSSIRTKEIGVKKVFGSVKGKLVQQFLSESLLNSLVALIVAFGISEFLLPFFRNMTDRQLEINYIGDWQFILFVVISALVLGLLSGIYPAFYLSRFNPVKVLKSDLVTSKRKKRFSFKKVLIAFQFIISITFVIGTIGFFANSKYIMTKDLGFDEKNLLCLSMKRSKDLQIKDIESLRQELKQNSYVENVSISIYIPFGGSSKHYIDYQGAQEGQRIKSEMNWGDEQFITTYKIPIVKGRNISSSLASDTTACVVNECFCRTLGWDDPIGKKIDGNKYTIVGVVRDFHQQSAIDEIDPYMLKRHGGKLTGNKTFTIRLKTGYDVNTLEAIKTKMSELFPDNYFEMKFVEDDLDNEVNRILLNVARTMMYFSGIAILIALVGVFSLVSFSVKRKVKSIGVRKVLGASISNLYIYLSKEFMILLLIANIIGVPLGMILLEAIPFAYKPDFNANPIIFVVLCSFIITFTSISYWILKTVRANPVDSLRYE